MIFLDLETYSDVKLSDVGADAYAEHPSTRILLLSYAFNDEPTELWDHSNDEPFPLHLITAIEQGETVVAHNIGFEAAVFEHQVGVKFQPNQIIDTMGLANSICYPAGLEALAKALSIPERKQTDGKKLIQLFCQPNRGRITRPEDAPDLWARFCAYAVQDTVLLRKVFHKMPKHNLDIYREEAPADFRMNRLGVAVDVDMCAKMLDAIDTRLNAVNLRIAELTDGEITTVNQRNRFLTHLERLGIPDLQKATVAAYLERDDLTPVERELLQLRAEAGGAATKKYKAFLLRTNGDNRLRGFMKLYGASRTGRWASSGVQLHNLMRPTLSKNVIPVKLDQIQNEGIEALATDEIMEVAASCIRSMLVAPAGRSLIVSDLSQIEARVLPWLAGDDDTLEVFQAGRDIYVDTASRMYDIPYGAVTDDQRFVGKTAVLALGFGQWVNGFIGFCKNYGVDMAEDDAYHIVTSWRNTHPEIVTYWKATENVVKKAIRCKGEGRTFFLREKVTVTHDGNDLLIKLPSGRVLCYRGMFIDRTGDLRFYDPNDVLVSTYGGRIVENMTQGLARDVLAYNIVNGVEQEESLDMLFSVHDEAICEADEDDEEEALACLDSILSNRPSWAPDLPLEAKGYIAKRYRK
jgi:DNA polymerase